MIAQEACSWIGQGKCPSQVVQRTCEHSTPHLSKSRFHFSSPKTLLKRVWVKKNGNGSS